MNRILPLFFLATLACNGDGADIDFDLDGFKQSEDCDDKDEFSFPGAPEVAHDGVDQDCDGADLVDEDNDGFVGVESGGDDCTDTNDEIFPGAEEKCDGADNDCSGLPDDDPAFTYYADNDGDDYGNPASSIISCDGAPKDHVNNKLDCDDNDHFVNPVAPEQCNGIDDNCDEELPADEADEDHDGYTICEGDLDDNDPFVDVGRYNTCAEAQFGSVLPSGTYEGSYTISTTAEFTAFCGWDDGVGPEVFVPIDLPPNTMLEATFELDNANETLFLVQDCEEELHLTCTDDSYSLPESITYTNSGVTALKAFLVLDSVDIITSGTNYTLTIEYTSL